MAAAHESPLWKNRLYLIIIVAAATAVTGLSTIMTYRNALQAAEDALKLQAYGISVSLEASLAKMPLTEGNIFRDIIAEGVWEGIAFLALYDAQGLTLLHSNENLIGKRTEDPSIKTVSDSGMPAYRPLVLGTGERVFVVDFPVHLQGSDRVLRVALHAYPAENIIRQAKLQMVSISILIALLWVTGVFIIRALRRNEELKKAITEKEQLALLGEMASVLAHEIRNPLGSIKGFAQYLLEQARDARVKSEVVEEYLGIIVSESRRLESLTEDLLVYSRPHRVNPQAFNLRELVEEVLDSFTHREGLAGIRIEHRVPEVSITSDRDRVKQILTNIIDNSLESLSGGGMVEIVAGVAGRMIVISVKDNGCGMDSETVENAFKPFFTMKTRGTGLGLAIVDKLVRGLGGTVTIASVPGNGTTVTVTLPRALQAETTQPPQ